MICLKTLLNFCEWEKEQKEQTILKERRTLAEWQKNIKLLVCLVLWDLKELFVMSDKTIEEMLAEKEALDKAIAEKRKAFSLQNI